MNPYEPPRNQVADDPLPSHETSRYWLGIALIVIVLIKSAWNLFYW